MLKFAATLQANQMLPESRLKGSLGSVLLIKSIIQRNGPHHHYLYIYQARHWLLLWRIMTQHKAEL